MIAAHPHVMLFLVVTRPYLLSWLSNSVAQLEVLITWGKFLKASFQLGIKNPAIRKITK